MPFITSLLTALIALFIYHKTDKIPGDRNRFAVRGVSLLIVLAIPPTPIMSGRVRA